ncbi:helicase-related protein [Vreelandella rituensis]|uniref:ATP-dependent DNA helicase RecG n=1 Tax=Vreelandella rituensis TaxID=2282306 RepID=A0A368U920_9GAMM|nr:helicase-related protein [Halomonas rituensis]RCV93699.1 hypothetical protein DU506_00670 [Halomonas rituensis]
MATTAGKPQDDIGRLTAFGVDKDAPWQALLLAPNRYLDLRQVVTALHQVEPAEEAQPRVIQGYITRPAEYDPVKKRTHLSLRLADDAGELQVMAFGHPNQMPGDWRRIDSLVAMQGNLLVKPDFQMLFAPTAIPPAHIGKAIGVYPSKTGVIGSDKVRERVLALLNEDNMRAAVDHVVDRLAPYAPADVLKAWGHVNSVDHMERTNLARILYRMHVPTSPEQGRRAVMLVRHLEALAAISAAERERPKTGVFQQVTHDPQTLESRIQAMSHTPTAEQIAAVQDSLADMASGRPMHRVLSGDVGTGKTTVYALLAAAVHDAGGEVAVMLPSSDMVNQVTREITHWWPDIEIEKVTGKKQTDSVEGARLKLGTTALLHRFDSWRPTLTVVDEEQKYSVDQRQQLVAGSGHLLEATATCMPRTMAKIQFGLVPVSRLTKPHTPKHITTQIRDAGKPDDKRALYEDLLDTIAEQSQVLVIFAARDAKEAKKLANTPVADGELDFEDEPDQKAQPVSRVIPLEEGLEQWKRAGGENKVVALHGKMKPAERKVSLGDMLSGRAQVLCATTAAEVGLNLPLLRQVIVYNAERLGLTQLHQLRGRVARLGGNGRCDLFVDWENLTDKARERLEALCATQDGFALAEMDMRQRGLGDLSSKANLQSGASDGGILRNSKLALEHFDVAQQMLEVLDAPESDSPDVTTNHQAGTAPANAGQPTIRASGPQPGMS